MQDVRVKAVVIQPGSNKFVSLAIILLVLIAAGFFVYQFTKTAPVPLAKTVISQNELEEQYGLRVNLVAVTAAGGFIDVRLKMVDGEKAKLLLTNKDNFPALIVGDLVLTAPEATRSQEMTFEKNATMFIMYPNSGNAVQIGTSVTILFGDTALEPITAK